ncbi:MAG: tyrosine-type recombinase/integrase [Campylobacteraceae bacterium]
MPNKMIKSSKKYDGIYHKILANGDLSYYITYKDKNKKVWTKVGLKSKGVNIPFCNQVRSDTINKLLFGEESPIIKYKNKDLGKNINDLIEDYLKTKELSQESKRKFKALCTRTIKILKREYLSEITPKEILKLKDTLKSENKAPKTINSYIETIRALFNFAIENELFKGVNPCKKVEMLKINNDRTRFLNFDEVLLLKETIKDNPTLLLFVELSLSTGGRLETILKIAKKDIDLRHKTITLQNLKSNNTYTGFIGDSLLPLLNKRYEAISNPNEYLVKTSSRTVRRQIKAVFDKLFNEGLDKADRQNRAVTHTLRHTFATNLAIKGVPIFTIKNLLDHKDIKDTMRYAKFTEDSGLEAVRGLW